MTRRNKKISQKTMLLSQHSDILAMWCTSNIVIYDTCICCFGSANRPYKALSTVTFLWPELSITQFPQWPFKFTQGNCLLYQSKAHVWFPANDSLWCVGSLRRFRDTASRRKLKPPNFSLSPQLSGPLKIYHTKIETFRYFLRTIAWSYLQYLYHNTLA